MDIMPPENQLPPHHAPNGLKVWLAIFAVVLVVALSYLVWVSNTTPDTTDNSVVVKKMMETVTVYDLTDKSKSLYSFSYASKYAAAIETENDHDAVLAVTVSSNNTQLVSVELWQGSPYNTPAAWEATVLETLTSNNEGVQPTNYKAGSTTKKIGDNLFYLFNIPNTTLVSNGAITLDPAMVEAVFFGKNGAYQARYTTVDKAVAEEILATIVEN